MKAFEVIQLILFAGLLIGVPVAATTRQPGESFSWVRSLTQAGVAAGFFVVLLAINFFAARIYCRIQERRKTK